MDEAHFEEMWMQLEELGVNHQDTKEALRAGMSLKQKMVAIGGSTKYAYYPTGNVFWYTIILKNIEDKYYLDKMLVTLRRNYPIQHFVFDNKDSLSLEERMRAIDWDGDYTSAKFKQECKGNDHLKQLHTEVMAIYQEVCKLMLSGNTQAMGVSMQLQQKYWLGSTFGVAINLHQGEQGVTPNVFYEFDLDHERFTIHEAYKLLSFRPLCKKKFTIPEGEQLVWYQLSMKGAEEFGQFCLNAYPDIDLNLLLDEIPAGVIKADRQDVIKKLQAGRMQIVTDGQQLLFISLDLETRSLVFADLYARRYRLQEFLDRLKASNGQEKTTGQQRVSPDQPGKDVPDKKKPRYVKQNKKKGRNGGPG